MTPKEFQNHIKKLENDFHVFFYKDGPAIAANKAVSLFKQNFQTESFFGEKWKEVKRRQATWKRNGKPVKNPTKGAARTRKILTGKTGDLGRSIEVKEVADGRAVIWANPGAFRSKEPYGRVHNEGLKAGRGAGFTMPKRQFMGDHPQLRQAIADELSKKLKQIFK
jgi:phage gpG-like protein